MNFEVFMIFGLPLCAVGPVALVFLLYATGSRLPLLAVFVSLYIGMAGGSAVMAWLPVRSVEQALHNRECGSATIDPTWRAVTCRRGRAHEFPCGTIKDNPLGFGAALLALFVGWGLFNFMLKRMRDGGVNRPVDPA
jgi:hypothetical protein